MKYVSTQLLQVAKSNDSQMMENLTDAIALTIRLHSEGEFQTLYPFMERTMGKEEGHVAECMAEHNKVEGDVLRALENRKQGGDKLSDAVDAVFNDFEKHMRHEEDECVVALLEKANEADLQEVAANFMRTKETAPLDPHPSPA